MIDLYDLTTQIKSAMEAEYNLSNLTGIGVGIVMGAFPYCRLTEISASVPYQRIFGSTDRVDLVIVSFSVFATTLQEADDLARDIGILFDRNTSLALTGQTLLNAESSAVMAGPIEKREPTTPIYHRIIEVTFWIQS